MTQDWHDKHREKLTEIRDEVESIIAERDRLREINKELLAGCKDLFALMEENQLVRNTASDHLPDFTTKAAAFAMRISKAHQAIAKAEKDLIASI